MTIWVLLFWVGYDHRIDGALSTIDNIATREECIRVVNIIMPKIKNIQYQCIEVLKYENKNS